MRRRQAFALNVALSTGAEREPAEIIGVGALDARNATANLAVAERKIAIGGVLWRTAHVLALASRCDSAITVREAAGARKDCRDGAINR